MPQMHVQDIEVVHDASLDEGEQLLSTDDPSELERGDDQTGS
jgi:hypothetical protein